MQPEQFLPLVQNPYEAIEKVAALKELAHQYPYFQIAHTLIAKAAYDSNEPSTSYVVQKAAIHATDRDHLRALLEETPPFTRQLEQEAITPVEEQSASPQAASADEHDFINSYIDHLRKREAHQITRKKVLDQLDIIQSFLDQNIQFKPQSLSEDAVLQVQPDLTQESTKLHEGLITENLAQVFRQQGNLARAIEVYNQLKLKFPEKSTYFDNFIKQLDPDN